MAISKSELLKEWIKYLKNNQIVDIKSDPQTGKLSYRRKVTSDDLFKFLEVNTNFDKSKISKAVRAVLWKKRSPAAPAPAPATSNNTDNKSRPEDHTTQEWEDFLNSEWEPLSHGKRSVAEALDDKKSHPLDEKDIEDIFDILTTAPENTQPDNSSIPPTNTNSPNRPRSASPAPAVDPEKKEEDIRKLKRVIRDTMTPNQRMALWRAIND